MVKNSTFYFWNWWADDVKMLRFASYSYLF